MPPEELKTLLLEAKKKRRNCKAAITRLGKVLDRLINEKRGIEEIQEIVLKIDTAFDNLVETHTAYTQMIDDEDEFETAEIWLDDVQNQVTTLKMYSKDYVKHLDDEFQAKTQNVEIPQSPDQINLSPSSSPNDNSLPTDIQINSDVNNIVDPDNHSIDDNPSKSAVNPSTSADDNPNPSTSAVVNPRDSAAANLRNSIAVNPRNSTAVKPRNSTAVNPRNSTAVNPNNFDADILSTENMNGLTASTSLNSNSVSGNPTQSTDVCQFKMEKPKMPKFSGDVREYYTFKSDFLHMVSSRYKLANYQGLRPDGFMHSHDPLMNRANNSNCVEKVWYFNGNVYAKAPGKRKVKIELFDNLDEKVNSAPREPQILCPGKTDIHVY
ncbi:hypothetical protein LOTGIDRAFT_158704 [Lottia gigantea]|uniref:Uncharacterized protein n=1 Tax=Lottia gigantea TaxID=225164 RepID=V4A4B5_LOTGI|nr:hypothetical protein LOTGIDRAFT_158704 [Lottia gigantea]ESO98758.1 hypothetical protein LOTGIDRAFT_158704 [Lottia gigantea]